MKMSSNKLFGVIAPFALILISCGQSSLPSYNSQQKFSDAELDFAPANLTRAPVSLSDVDVYNLVVANTRDHGLPARSLHFAATGTSDFVEIQLCHAEKGCQEALKLVVDELLLNAHDVGNYVVHARACVFPERAVESPSPCGDWKSAEFQLSNPVNSEVLLLISERAAKLSEFDAQTKALQQTLETFLKDSQACLVREENAKRIGAIRGITQNFLSLGETLIGHSLRQGVEKETAKYSGMPVSPVKKPLAQNSEKLAKFTEYDAAIKKIAIARGYFDEALPVSAVQTLGMAVFDIFTAKQQTPGACLAKDKATREIAAIEANMAALKSRISEIESLLAERGQQ